MNQYTLVHYNGRYALVADTDEEVMLTARRLVRDWNLVAPSLFGAKGMLADF
jgi:hypothetical protein